MGVLMITFFKILRAWKEIGELVSELVEALADAEIDKEEAMRLIGKAAALFTKLGFKAD